MAQNQNLPRVFQTEQNVLENIKVFFPDIQITIHDLRNPMPEMVSMLYGAFLEELGANIANLFQIQNNQMTLIDHVDIYNVSVPILNQCQCINFFLKRIGADKFNVSDLVAPTSKRTLHFFDALLKFLASCDEKVANLQPELGRIRDLGLYRKELLSKIEDSRNDINRRASARGQRRDKMKELEKAIGPEKVKLDQVMDEKEEHVTAQTTIKKLLEEDAEKESQLIQTMKKIENDVIELKEMIVKSPGKLKHQVEEQIQKKEELLQTRKILKNQIEEKKRLTQTIIEQHLKQEERFQKIRDVIDIKLSIKDKDFEKLDLLDQYAKKVELYNESKLCISSQMERRRIMMENVEEHRQRKEKWELDEKEQLYAAEKELKMLISHREEKVKHSDEIQTEMNEVFDGIKQIEEQFLEYKEAEKASRSKQKSIKDKLVLKYENIIVKLKMINDKLKK